MPYQTASRIPQPWTQRNIPRSERGYWKTQFPGSSQGFGTMGGGGTAPPKPLSPQVLMALIKMLGEGEQDQRKWTGGLLDTMGSNARSQLAGTMGSQLSRTNTAVPVGMGALANKYMSGMDDQFSTLRQLINQPNPAVQNISQAMSLGEGLMPSFGGRGRDTEKLLEQLRQLLRGGGR